MRLLPGEGELPLAGLVAALPADLPVSVEAPSLAARRDLSPAEYAARARRSLASAGSCAACEPNARPGARHQPPAPGPPGCPR